MKELTAFIFILNLIVSALMFAPLVLAILELLRCIL